MDAAFPATSKIALLAGLTVTVSAPLGVPDKDRPSIYPPSTFSYQITSSPPLDPVTISKSPSPSISFNFKSVGMI